MTRLLAIVGPTAAGKSRLALSLATRFDGEIVNADSRLFYRGFDIGTAKPIWDERRSVPHHLIDFLNADETLGLARFIELAAKTCKAVAERGRLPILVGGTGQYVWGLLEGWQVPRVPPNPELRLKLEALVETEGAAAVFAHLEKLDPEAAHRVDAKNPRRVIRAIEIATAVGPSSAPSKAVHPPFDHLVLGVDAPRDVLYRRIDDRIDAMVASGWLQEIATLLKSGVRLDAPGMSAIGYREMAAAYRGKISLAEAVVQTRAATRQLVRRQGNWFRKTDSRIHWLEGDVERQAARAVEEWLGE